MSCCSGKIRNIGSMATGFALSMMNAVTYAVKTGKVMADRSVIQTRITTCKSCEFFSQNRCKACGCYIVVKTGLHAEKCPKGFW